MALLKPVDNLLPVPEPNHGTLNFGHDRLNIGLVLVDLARTGSHQSPYPLKTVLVYGEQFTVDVHPGLRVLKRPVSHDRSRVRRSPEQEQ